MENEKFCKRCKHRNNKTGFCHHISGYVARKAVKDCFVDRKEKK